MTRWRAENGDLFELPQPTGAVLAPQREVAIKLLATLLMEASRPAAEQAIPANMPEADHDEGHA